MIRPRTLVAALAALLLVAAPTLALDAVVTKRTVSIPNFRFATGDTIPELKLGVETYGRLNAAKTNAILICHFFAGDSHAAGTYRRGTPRKGWWDDLIGPGEAIDTNRYYVICTDLPVGMMVKRDTVVTTGPRTIDPRTGKPYGNSFPFVTLHDMVQAQRAVLDVLGVRRLKLVTGPSMGGMIALQWAVTRPLEVDQVAAVSAPIGFSSTVRSGFQSAAAAIRFDPLWLWGDYQSWGVEPDNGVAMALYGLSAISEGKAYTLPWQWMTYVQEARQYDANHYLRTIDLHTSYELGAEYGGQANGLRRISSRVLLLGSRDDEFVTPDDLEQSEQTLRTAGVRVQRVMFDGQNGHLSCLEDQGAFAPALRALLR